VSHPDQLSVSLGGAVGLVFTQPETQAMAKHAARAAAFLISAPGLGMGFGVLVISFKGLLLQ
jgi:hypothetical protein